MDVDIGVALTAFALIVPVELPDKTFVATLVLATRFRATPVWLGVGVAFVIQSLVAVVAGGLISALPETYVHIASMLLFAVGAFLLLRSARRADLKEAEQEHEFEKKMTDGPVGGWRAFATSFLVLFAAEWGDLSQLLSAGMAARFGAPVEVFIGSVAGLLLVSGVAAVAGRTILKRVRLGLVQTIGGLVCAGLAVFTAVQLILS